MHPRLHAYGFLYTNYTNPRIESSTQEKVKKVVDIWVKAATFDARLLRNVQEKVNKAVEEESGAGAKGKGKAKHEGYYLFLFFFSFLRRVLRGRLGSGR